MVHCNAAISPVEPMMYLSKNEDEQDVNPTQYRRLIESLCYLCNTRPNLAFSVSIVSRFTVRPNLSHLEAVKRILCYVKGSFGCGILFPATDTGIKCNLLGFTDSNWCGDKDDRTSIARYIFMFDATPISWCSKKEPLIALSSYEAEHIVTSLCVCQPVWLMNLLEELGNSDSEVITLLADKVSTINFAKNPIVHGMSKHIEMRFHYLRELVSD
ncbi:secreted RxLR effector protein 161-like [Lathyrus oleraceus]|uniref:secreted RxLR effector protein 161-like n=1 Tax=Pisum sativum TaxID=3888 RepID=UPI0021D0FC6C|nr:secreted RxLR effector protein 161-like [Pisum sativum]